MRTALEPATAHSFDVYVATERNAHTRRGMGSGERGVGHVAGYKIDGTCGAIKTEPPVGTLLEA